MDMKKDPALLAQPLASVVGSAYVTENRSLTVQTHTPAFIVKPATAEEARDCLRVCAEFGAAVVPAGRMTWLDGGNLLRRADCVLSLERMNRVIDYSPPDLTA